MNRISCGLGAVGAAIGSLAISSPALAGALVAGGAARLTGECGESRLSGGETSCDAVESFSVATTAGAHYWIRFTAPPEHCSSAKYRLWAGADPHVEWLDSYRGETPFLDPGESATLNAGPFPVGETFFYVAATGRVGGCNEGALGSWAVDVEPFVGSL